MQTWQVIALVLLVLFSPCLYLVIYYLLHPRVFLIQIRLFKTIVNKEDDFSVKTEPILARRNYEKASLNQLKERGKARAREERGWLNGEFKERVEKQLEILFRKKP